MSELEPPRFVDGPPLHIAGLNGHFNRAAAPAALTAIPLQWQSNSGIVEIWVPIES